VLTIYDQFQTNPAGGTAASVYHITDTQFDMILSDEEIAAWLDEDGNSIGSSGKMPLIAYWDSSNNLYIPINAYDEVIELCNDASPFSGQCGWRFNKAIVKNNKITFYYPYPFTSVGNTSGWTDYGDCIDWDNTSYGYDDLLATQSAVIFGFFETDLQDYIGTWDDIYLYAIAYHNSGGADVIDAAVQVYDRESNLVGASKTGTVSSPDKTYKSLFNYLMGPPSGLGFDTGANAKMHDVSETSGGTSLVDAGDWATLNWNRYFRLSLYPSLGAAVRMRLYEFGLCFAKTIPLNEKSKLYAYIQGREFQDTWGARKIAAAMVENPADVIEKILRDDLGVASADIDTTAFDAVSGTDRVFWDLAYTINKEISSLDEFEAICKEAFLVYYKKYDGDHTIEPLKTSGSADKNLTKNDVKTLEDDEHTSTFNVRHSPLSEVYNEFFVHYDKDPATDDYLKVAFVKDPDAGSYSSNYVSTAAASSDLNGNEEDYWDKCELSYDTYGFKRTKHIYLDRVRDPRTADNILCMAIDWFYLRKAEVSFYTQLQNCDLEIGDLIGLPAELREDTYWLYGIEEDLNNDTIFLEMREL